MPDKPALPLADIRRQLHVNGFRRKAFFVIAGLIPELTIHNGRPWGSVGSRLKLRHNIKAAGINGDRLFRKFKLLHLRLWIDNLFRFERAFGPGELERNQIFVRWRIAIYMKARF